MSASLMLDANTCIYALNRRMPSLLQRVDQLKPGEAVLSVVVWAELMFGITKSRSSHAPRAYLDALTEKIPVLALSLEVGLHYAEIRYALERKGTPIGNNDLWIAAHARAEGLTLVTNNEREFKRVPGLKVQNWAA